MGNEIRPIKQKGFAPILILVLLVALGAVGYFSYKTYTSSKGQVSGPYSQSPVASSSLQTYTDSDFGFQFLYPKTGDIQKLTRRDDFLLGGVIYKLIKSSDSQPQSSEVDVRVYDANNMSLEDWIKSNSTTQHFGAAIPKEFYGYVGLGQKSVAGINGESFRDEMIDSTENSVVIKKGNYVYVISNLEVADDLSTDYDQILSTFKFTQ